MSGETIESELKFRADDRRPLDLLASASTLGEAALGPALTISERDRYLDTRDLRLAASGWACRLRTRAGETRVLLKGPARHAGGDLLHRRAELEGPADATDDPTAWPASEARQLLVDMSRGLPLRERFILEQERTEREVRLANVRAGLLSIDRVVVWHAGRSVGRLEVVELELDPAALSSGLDPTPLAAALAARAGLFPDPLTKLEHALGLIGTVGG